MTIWTGLRGWARTIKRDVVALSIAGRDPRVRWHVKLAAAAVAAYALSPIDLIPDFIPILGYLDDVIIVPLGILLVVRMLPPRLLAEFRDKAHRLIDRPTSRAGTMMIVGIWMTASGAALWAFWPTAVP